MVLHGNTTRQKHDSRHRTADRRRATATASATRDPHERHAPTRRTPRGTRAGRVANRTTWGTTHVTRERQTVDVRTVCSCRNGAKSKARRFCSLWDSGCARGLCLTTSSLALWLWHPGLTVSLLTGARCGYSRPSTMRTSKEEVVEEEKVEEARAAAQTVCQSRAAAALRRRCRCPVCQSWAAAALRRRCPAR